MTTKGNAMLDAGLRDLTQWDGPKTALWHRALVESSLIRSGRILGRFRGRRFLPFTIGVSAAAVLFLTAVSVNLVSPRFSTQEVRNAADSTISSASLRGVGQAMYIDAQGGEDGWPLVRRENRTPTQFLSPSTTVAVSGPLLNSQSTVGTSSTPTSFPTDSRRVLAARHVIHNVNIDLKSGDVRAVFLKVQQLVRPELGEYVQGSSQSGSGAEMSANLTLRVATARLSDVLNELRELATVQSESQSGRDVTDQVVDLEARLRNEQRIEQELLRLLDERKDAPLADVIQLREKLKDVRGEIERLAGQRVALAGLTDLATILVIIHSADVPAVREGGFSDRFGKRINAAWSSGLDFMTGTLATMLQILVGGIGFWVVLLTFVIFIMRRRQAR